MKSFILAALLTAVCIPAFNQTTNNATFIININDTVQTIRNIGASACWYAEEIGSQWPLADKQRLAELLFSRDVDEHGQPKGIGLSAFRFNIGAGTAEQGDNSGIPEVAHRVECFLSPDGTYNWNKQKGYVWMLQQAKKYGVENLIAFVNSPPVQFTKDGLGYKLAKDYVTNLKPDAYTAYANFLAIVVKHFDDAGMHFNYLSPVNEPQWDWSGAPGSAKQEGSPWTNTEIYNTINTLSQALTTQKLTTKILMPEAATLSYLYESTGKSSKQLAAFYNPASPLYVSGLNNITPFVEGHGYFTEMGDAKTIQVRTRLRDSLKQYGHGLEYWQSEYCMLGDGFREGQKNSKRSAMDCALFLAKIIHTDLTSGNATAWHFWNSFEPGDADSNTLYYLVALNRNRAKDTANRYTITKNAWALGHYSLFIRPGMKRVTITRNDGLDDVAAAQDIMISAYRDAHNNNLVVNVINYTMQNRDVTLQIQGLTGNGMHLTGRYVTSANADDNLKPYSIKQVKTTANGTVVTLPARSITSFIFKR